MYNFISDVPNTGLLKTNIKNFANGKHCKHSPTRKSEAGRHWKNATHYFADTVCVATLWWIPLKQKPTTQPRSEPVQYTLSQFLISYTFLSDSAAHVDDLQFPNKFCMRPWFSHPYNKLELKITKSSSIPYVVKKKSSKVMYCITRLTTVRLLWQVICVWPIRKQFFYQKEIYSIILEVRYHRYQTTSWIRFIV